MDEITTSPANSNEQFLVVYKSRQQRGEDAWHTDPLPTTPLQNTRDTQLDDNR